MPSVSPVSYKVHVKRLPRKGMPVTIDATFEQRQALSLAHGLFSVQSYRADIVAEPWKRDGVRVHGRIEAVIEQACVVTLKPLSTRIDERVDALFVPQDSPLAIPAANERGEIIVEAEGLDPPEAFAGDWIDAGALTEEIFALAIDPYPRIPGARIEAPQDEEAEEPRLSPFAKLQALKRKG